MKKNKVSVLLLVTLIGLVMTNCQIGSRGQVREILNKTIEASEQLLLATSKLKNRIEMRVRQDSIDSVKELLPAINDLENKVKGLKSELSAANENEKNVIQQINKAQITIANVSETVEDINEGISQVLEKTLESDISFETGSANLSKQGKNVVQERMVIDIDKALAAWDDRRKSYKDKEKNIQIRIVGYADLQGSANVERRQTQNERLSLLRAQAVKSHLEEQLQQLSKRYKMKFKVNSFGYGESLPPGVIDTSTIDNPSRRICKIWIYIFPPIA